MKPRHQAQFFQQLEMLLGSGVLIVDALAHLKERYPDRSTRRVLAAVHADIAASRTRFSRALGRHPKIFALETVALVEAAEENGTARLAERCGDIAAQIARHDARRSEVRRACAYPLLVLGLAAGLGVLLLSVVFPRLELLLSSLGSDLPPLARSFLAASHLVRVHGWALAAGPAGTALTLLAARRWPPTGEFCDQMVLRLPLVGAVLGALLVARVCQMYRSLYAAGKPAPEILAFCAQATDNRWLRLRLREAAARIETSGANVADALGRSGLFPPLACLALDVGERSGQLGVGLERLSEHYSAEARQKIAAAVAVLNPALTLLVVAGVGSVSLSFFQAIYQIVEVTR